MFLYETHLHTYPVSRCAHAGVREVAEFYKNAGYAGIFITNHFLDGNINIDRTTPYPEKIEFYFSDYEDGLQIGKELGIKVFCGVELSYCGADFLVGIRIGAFDAGFPHEKIYSAKDLNEAMAHVRSLKVPDKMVLLLNDLTDNYESAR